MCSDIENYVYKGEIPDKVSKYKKNTFRETTSVNSRLIRAFKNKTTILQWYFDSSFWFDNELEIESKYYRKIVVLLLKLESCVYKLLIFGVFFLIFY